jgi:hypothetical protein
VTGLSQGLDEDADEIAVIENSTVEFEGPLKSFQFRDTSVQLEIQSFEYDAKNAEPTGPKKDYTGADDSTIVQDAINGIPDLSAGTIDTVETGVDVLFNHATRALQIRFCRRLSKAQVRYNSDKTVDYLSPGTLGTDRTGTTISPANQNLTQSDVRQRGGKNSKTHLRVIGSGGTSINVAADSYSSGNPKRWGRAVFKEVGEPNVLKTLGKKLLSELSNEWLEFKATLTNVSDVELGDEFTVNYPEKDVNNETLEVAEVTTIRDSTGESGTEKHYEVVLSNRSFARQQAFGRQQERVSNNYRTGQTTASQNAAGANIPVTTLPPGESVATPFAMSADETFYLWSVNVKRNDGVTIPENVFAQVTYVTGVAPGTDVVGWEDNVLFRSGNPLYKLDLSNDVFGECRLTNRSTSTYELGARFSYTTEVVQ